MSTMTQYRRNSRSMTVSQSARTEKIYLPYETALTLAFPVVQPRPEPLFDLELVRTGSGVKSTTDLLPIAFLVGKIALALAAAVTIGILTWPSDTLVLWSPKPHVPAPTQSHGARTQSHPAIQTRLGRFGSGLGVLAQPTQSIPPVVSRVSGAGGAFPAAPTQSIRIPVTSPTQSHGDEINTNPVLPFKASPAPRVSDRPTQSAAPVETASPAPTQSQVPVEPSPTQSITPTPSATPSIPTESPSIIPDATETPQPPQS